MHAYTFQGSDCITFANVPLAKASHMTNPIVDMWEGDYTETWCHGEVYDSLGAITIIASSISTCLEISLCFSISSCLEARRNKWIPLLLPGGDT